MKLTMRNISDKFFGGKKNVQISYIAKAAGFHLNCLIFMLGLGAVLLTFSSCSTRQPASKPQISNDRQARLTEDKVSRQRAEISDKKLDEIKTDGNWQKDPEAFAKLFFGENLSIRSRRSKATLIKKPKVSEMVKGSRVEWPATLGISPAWLGMEKNERKTLDQIMGNMAIYCPFGPDVTGWIWLMHGSRREGTEEIEWWEMSWGIPPQSDVLLKMEIDSVRSFIFKNGMLVMYVTGSDLQIETPSKKSDWPAYSSKFGAAGPYSSSHQEVQITNSHEFHIKVGLRSNDKGRDFIVPPQGVASAFVPEAKYDIYFQYSSDPTSLYKGDSFQLKDNGVEIILKGAVDGNYSIQRVE
ncbi:MAG: hypothetical protein WBC05_07530 [Sedimentisphaerales bacterium]